MVDSRPLFSHSEETLGESSQPGERVQMNDKGIVRARLLPDGTAVEVLEDGTTRAFESKSDWARVDAMTEEEIEQNALSDPDNPPLSRAELERMVRVPNPKEIRRRMHLTQEQFAIKFHLRLGTLRDWEQGVKEPDSAAKVLLRVIEREPAAVLRALER
jgi:putative transcriptional regulator